MIPGERVVAEHKLVVADFLFHTCFAEQMCQNHKNEVVEVQWGNTTNL